jgi:hypothetical protein
MQKPASLIPLKNILLLWSESSDHSAFNTTEERQREFLAENERLHPGGAAWAGRILNGCDMGGVS